MASLTIHTCPRCNRMFPSDQDYKTHLKNLISCSRRDPHAFTIELGRMEPIKTIVFSAVPETVESRDRHAESSSESASVTVTSDTLLGAMEGAMKKPVRERGIETSILTAIAEGDDDLATAYSNLSIDPKTGTKRLTKEIVEAVSLKSKIDVEKLASMIGRAQRVSLCFLLDTTGSMGSYISGVKDQIIEMVSQVKASGCKIVGLAFVGYKDWSEGVNHFEILTFTTDIKKFKSFVLKISATGGGDEPEDVVGGMDRALSLDWPSSSGSRVLFHLGDSPPHGGPKYHNYEDDYPTGHSSDKPLKTLFGEMQQKKITYFFGRINNHCDRMIQVFEKYYGKKIDSFASESVSSIWRSVVAAVSRSVSSSSDESTSASRLGHLKHRKFKLDEKKPIWSEIPCLEGTILSFKLPESIKFITSFTKLQEEIFKCKLQVAPNPFAKGSIRLAYYGKILGKREDNVVFKEIISVSTVEELDRQRYMTDLEVQTIAAKLAFEFNGRLCRTKANPNVRLKFLMAKVVRVALPDGTCRFMAFEKSFPGAKAEMIKYTNNLSFVLNPKMLDKEGQVRLKIAVAFSHFSYDVTDSYLLVCDLQGISTVDSKGKATFLLTDPAIHCSTHYRFGKTNLQEVGIQKFFEKHVCNEFCRALGLVKPKF